MTKPIIGITLDSQKPGGYSDLPWYALRTEYFSAVAKAGGIPLGLSHEHGCIKDYLATIDGLLLTGGDVDIPPEWYGAKSKHKTVQLNDSRTKFEWELAKGALKKDMPVLGVCAGEQLLGVMLGGTLVQHIPDEVKGALEHKQKISRLHPTHEVTIEKGTMLHRITGKTKLKTNSSHHQAVKSVGKDAVISARTKDGVVEAIESLKHRFCIGIEWHPELMSAGEADARIIKAFVKAAGK